VAGVASVVGPMFGFAFGLGFVLPNAVAGAIGPFPRMAGLASAVLGFVQLTGSALYAVAVGHFHDETLRPMATGVALAGLLALTTFASMTHRR
jgi:DHA1 family bicyclomycin/chloramphenicol resistance-like MFS transporter